MILKGIFELFTGLLGLPIEWHWEYVILLLIGGISYIKAWNKVGDLYRSGIISGSSTGSDLHWLIKLLWFVALWAITYALICAVRFIMNNRQIILFAVCSVVGTVVICRIAVIIMRKIKSWR